jgi:hypothetical protein
MNSENDNSSNKCKHLFGLYFTEPDANDCKYVHAFSFSKQILEDMIINNCLENEKDYYSINPVSMFAHIVVKINTSDISDSEKKNYNLLFDIGELNYADISGPLYGFNYMKNDIICDQILLSTQNITKYLEKEGISSNPIQIDTFYEESILNA